LLRDEVKIAGNEYDLTIPKNKTVRAKLSWQDIQVMCKRFSLERKSESREGGNRVRLS